MTRGREHTSSLRERLQQDLSVVAEKTWVHTSRGKRNTGSSHSQGPNSGRFSQVSTDIACPALDGASAHLEHVQAAPHPIAGRESFPVVLEAAVGFLCCTSVAVPELVRAEIETGALRRPAEPAKMPEVHFHLNNIIGIGKSSRNHAMLRETFRAMNNCSSFPCNALPARNKNRSFLNSGFIAGKIQPFGFLVNEENESW